MVAAFSWLVGLAPALVASGLTLRGVLPSPWGYALAALLLAPAVVVAERVCGRIERRHCRRPR